MNQIFGILWGITLLYLYPKCDMTAEIWRIRRAARQAISSGSNLIQIEVNTVFLSSTKQPIFSTSSSNLKPYFKVWLCCFLPWIYKLSSRGIIFCTGSQCRRCGGARGASLRWRQGHCLGHAFRFIQTSFLEHYVTTRQLAIMEKGIIIFKHDSRLKFSRLFAKLLATYCCT